MEITNPHHGDIGWEAVWISKDHDPGPDEDYDAAYAEYENPVFTTRDEAAKTLMDNYLNGGVEWGYIASATFEFGAWSTEFESQEWYYDL